MEGTPTIEVTTSNYGIRVTYNKYDMLRKRDTKTSAVFGTEELAWSFVRHLMSEEAKKDEYGTEYFVPSSE